MAEDQVRQASGLAIPTISVRRVLIGIARFLAALLNFLIPPAFVAACGAWSALYYVQSPGVIRTIFDDSYISLTFARNLAQHGILSFDGVHWSTGATSPLHVAVLAELMKLGVPDLMTGIDVGVFSHAALTVMVFALATAIFHSRLAGLLAGVAIAFSPYAALDAGNGLETSMFMALMTASMAAFFLVRNAWGKLLTGILIALTILTRPEGAFLLPAAVLYRFIDRKPGESLLLFVRDSLLIGLPACGALAFLMGLSWSVNGTIGGTATAKLKFFQENRQPLPSKLSIASDNLAIFLAPMFTLVVLASVAVRRRETALFAMFWVPVIIFYTLLFPGGLVHYFFRYQHPVVPLVCVLAGGGAALLIEQALKNNFVAKILVVAALAVVVLPLWYQYARWQILYRDASYETLVDLEGMGRDLDSIIKPNETLAAHDIGVESYYGHYKILDLVGLVNPDVVPFHKDHTVKEYVDQVKPDYLLIFPDWDYYYLHIYPGDNPARYELVKVYEGRNIRVLPYVLYRIHWDIDDPTLAPPPPEDAPEAPPPTPDQPALAPRAPSPPPAPFP